MVTMDCKEKRDNEGSPVFLACQVHLEAPDLKVIEDTSAIQGCQEPDLWVHRDPQDHGVH